MRIALDTNRYTDLCRGDASLVALLESADAVLLPYVVAGELRAGFAVGSKGAENERTLTRFLESPGVDLLLPSDATTRAYATLYLQLRAQGSPIPTNDLWIAALVIEHGLVLCTRDEHFSRLPQLPTC